MAELAAGTVPGAAVQAGMSQAAMKAENRNPLDKNSKSLPGMADALKDW